MLRLQVELQSWLGLKKKGLLVEERSPLPPKFERVEFECFASVSAKFFSCVPDVESLSFVVGWVVIAESKGAIAASQLSL